MADFDFLARHAAATPGKVALIAGERMVDFETLNRRANMAANVLQTLGCVAQDRVAVMSFNSIEGFEISNGLRKVSLVGVPVNYRLRGSEIAYVLNDSGAKVVIAGPELVDFVDAARGEVAHEARFIALGDHAPAGWLSYLNLMAAASGQTPGDTDGGALGASMIYTSGTTGHPKGAWRPNGVNIENVLQVISIFELAESDVHLMCGPGYHSAVSFFSALNQVLGATIVVQPKFDADGALDAIARHGVTTSFMAPTLLQRLTDAQVRNPRDTSSLRALILGAAPCPHALKVRAQAAFGEVLWEFYGATETGINTVLRPEDQLRKPGSCGRPYGGIEIKVVDDDGNALPTGQPGELFVRSPLAIDGYHATEERLAELGGEWKSVGDVAYVDDEGYVYICDRKKDMVITGGMNVNPAEIEAVLHSHPDVMDVAVFGIPDDEWGERVHAVVQPRAGATIDLDALAAYAEENLANYKRPRSWQVRDQLPRTESGKLLKRVLRDEHWAGRSSRV